MVNSAVVAGMGAVFATLQQDVWCWQ